MADRRLALDTLAFINDPAASKAMLALAAPLEPVPRGRDVLAAEPDVEQLGGPRPAPALEVSRHLRSGRDRPERGRRAAAARPDAVEPSVAEVVRLTGERARGKDRVSIRCQVCHTIGGTGYEVGPALDGWGRGKSPDVIATAIVDPNADIAQGYDGTEIRTKDGVIDPGHADQDRTIPLMMRSMGGVTQIIPANRVAERRRMAGSLMMSAAQLGLTPQDVADIVAFLRR